MRRNQIDAILAEQAKRRNIIFGFICVIVVFSILSFSLFLVYNQKNKDNYVTYDEKSNIDYKVYLKENEFFEKEYLESSRQYIASLIDYVTADFEYNLSFDSEDVEYQYEYRIEANVNVYDKDTNNVLYNKSEEILQSENYLTTEREVKIKKSVDIDYNEYNDLIYKFVNLYGLDNVESVLTIDMYVNTIGSCEKFEENSENESVMSLSIPLTTQTVAIEISNDLIDTENNVMLCETNKLNYIILVFAILSLLVDIIIIVCLVRYEIKTRTADTIYMKKLKKILNNYGSYIQEIKEDFSQRGYQVVKVGTFEDMLEIRDTIRQPILMKQNVEKTCTYFVIPSTSKYLYIYRLDLEDIEEEIEKNK